jgi:uncharacterized protein YacL
MAFVRRRFVSAIVVDGVLVSFILVAGLMHAVSRGHHDSVERSAIRPLIGHTLHAFIGLVGAVGVSVPVASAPSRTLKWLAPLAMVADTLALGAQARSAALDDETLNEFTVFSLLAILLAVSAINVYWAASAELATFGSLRIATARDYDA